MSRGDRKVVWNKQAEKAFKNFPDEVKDSFRQALEHARRGQHPEIADPYGPPLGAGYFKLKDDDTRGNTYRSVYYAKYEEAIYVLHAFQKKSKSGKSDPAEEVATARARVKWVELQHELWRLEKSEKIEQTGKHQAARKGGKK
jgi:phage-related protein